MPAGKETNATALHLHSSITSDDSLEVIARKLNREKELALEQTCALFDYARLQKSLMSSVKRNLFR